MCDESASADGNATGVPSRLCSSVLIFAARSSEGGADAELESASPPKAARGLHSQAFVSK